MLMFVRLYLIKWICCRYDLSTNHTDVGGFLTEDLKRFFGVLHWDANTLKFEDRKVIYITRASTRQFPELRQLSNTEIHVESGVSGGKQGLVFVFYRSMEVFQTENHYIILDGEYSLWCSRRHGTLEPKTGEWHPPSHCDVSGGHFLKSYVWSLSRY